ncbi:hypothetical protein ACFRKE_01085 [Kitasatospora indigofera]|uniref:hypothetical protein n=1 Tax=Kitasatospora indigofera TaxID=67307 RepID=UPI0036BEC164
MDNSAPGQPHRAAPYVPKADARYCVLDGQHRVSNLNHAGRRMELADRSVGVGEKEDQ